MEVVEERMLGKNYVLEEIDNEQMKKKDVEGETDKEVEGGEKGER